jgi:N-acetylneuraminic acid mutarotase
VPRTHTAVGSVDNFLIVAGGNQYDFTENGYSHGTIRDTTEVFDLSHPARGWQRRAPIPAAGRGWSGSVIAKQHLYLFGGITWNEAGATLGTRETLRYDPKTDHWQKMTPPPLAISGWEGALYADRYAILAGGVMRPEHEPVGTTVWSDLVWAYDSQRDHWLRVNGILPPGAVFNDPGVAILGNTIYVLGAEGPSGSHYNYFLMGRIKPNAP